MVVSKTLNKYTNILLQEERVTPCNVLKVIASLAKERNPLQGGRWACDEDKGNVKITCPRSLGQHVNVND